MSQIDLTYLLTDRRDIDEVNARLKSINKQTLDKLTERIVRSEAFDYACEYDDGTIRPYLQNMRGAWGMEKLVEVSPSFSTIFLKDIMNLWRAINARKYVDRSCSLQADNILALATNAIANLQYGIAQPQSRYLCIAVTEIAVLYLHCDYEVLINDCTWSLKDFK